MIELSPLAVGCIGVVVLLALCFAGVRFAFAGAITGTAGLVWLIGWIRSWARLPHVLVDGQLHLHMGSLRHVTVPVAQVARVVRQVDAARLAQPGTRKLVPLAFPNRIIELTEPLQGRRAIRALAIRLDDPADFDSALAGLGITID